MEYKNIKVHKPWYARGTPVTNPRDGPAMALSDKPLFAIRVGPSARGEPPGFPHPWLTLITMFFNAQKRVFGNSYAQTLPLADDSIADKEMEFIKNQTRRVDTIIEMDMTDNIKTRRVDMIIETDMMCAAKTLRVDMIMGYMIKEKSINDGQQKYHPSWVSVQQHDLCYNPTIRQNRIENPPRLLVGNMIMDIGFVSNLKPRRGNMIIDADTVRCPKTRRVDTIIDAVMHMMGNIKTRRVDTTTSNNYNE
jgi:hypothetical protein